MTPNIASLHTGSSGRFTLHTLLLINSPVRLSHDVVTLYVWVCVNDIYPLSSFSQSPSWSMGTNCAASETGNDGCGVQFADPASFGPPFNYNGGGWYDLILSSHKDADSHHRYVVQRTDSEIRIYFWPRNGDSVPDQVKSSLSHESVDPDSWVRAFGDGCSAPFLMNILQGVPTATWTNDSCDFAKHFGLHNIIINLTFCMIVFLARWVIVTNIGIIFRR